MLILTIDWFSKNAEHSIGESRPTFLSIEPSLPFVRTIIIFSFLGAILEHLDATLNNLLPEDAFPPYLAPYDAPSLVVQFDSCTYSSRLRFISRRQSTTFMTKIMSGMVKATTNNNTGLCPHLETHARSAVIDFTYN